MDKRAGVLGAECTSNSICTVSAWRNNDADKFPLTYLCDDKSPEATAAPTECKDWHFCSTNVRNLKNDKGEEINTVMTYVCKDPTAGATPAPTGTLLLAAPTQMPDAKEGIVAAEGAASAGQITVTLTSTEIYMTDMMSIMEETDSVCAVTTSTQTLLETVTYTDYNNNFTLPTTSAGNLSTASLYATSTPTHVQFLGAAGMHVVPVNIILVTLVGMVGWIGGML